MAYVRVRIRRRKDGKSKGIAIRKPKVKKKSK